MVDYGANILLDPTGYTCNISYGRKVWSLKIDLLFLFLSLSVQLWWFGPSQRIRLSLNLRRYACVLINYHLENFDNFCTDWRAGARHVMQELLPLNPLCASSSLNFVLAYVRISGRYVETDHRLCLEKIIRINEAGLEG